MKQRISLLLITSLLVTTLLSGCSSEVKVSTITNALAQKQDWYYTYNIYTQYFDKEEESTDTQSEDSLSANDPETADYYGIKMEVMNKGNEYDIKKSGYYVPEPYFSWYVSANDLDVTDPTFLTLFYDDTNIIFSKDENTNIWYQYSQTDDEGFSYEVPHLTAYEHFMMLKPTDITNWKIKEKLSEAIILIGTYKFLGIEYAAELAVTKTKEHAPVKMSLLVENASATGYDTETTEPGWERIDYEYFTDTLPMALSQNLIDERKKQLDAIVTVDGSTTGNNYTLECTTLSHDSLVPVTTYNGDKYVTLSRHYNVTVVDNELKYVDTNTEDLDEKEQQQLEEEVYSQRVYPPATISIPYEDVGTTSVIVDDNNKMYKTTVQSGIATADISGISEMGFQVLGIMNNDGHSFHYTDNDLEEALLDLENVKIVEPDSITYGGNFVEGQTLMQYGSQYFQVLTSNLSVANGDTYVSMNKVTKAPELADMVDGNVTGASYDYTTNYLLAFGDQMEEEDQEQILAWYTLDDRSFEENTGRETLSYLRPIIEYIFAALNITDYDLLHTNGYYAAAFSEDRRTTVEIQCDRTDTSFPEVVKIYVEQF